ncbi:phage minor head protein [Halovulum sp. GXIMD14793]
MAFRAEQRRLVEAALKRYSPDVARAFREAMQIAGADVDYKALVAALDAGQVERAVELLRIRQSTMFSMTESIRTAYVAGGIMAELPAAAQGVFRFDGRHPRADAWASEHSAQLVQGLTEDGVQAARAVISDGIGTVPPNRLALDLVGRRVGSRRVGGFIGLSAAQTDSILAARAKLMSGDPSLMREYLSLKQRDRRHDRTVLQAIKEGQPVTGRTLDRVMEAHKSKALAYRGRVISRTETHTALAAGREESFRQMAERDDIEAVTARWQHNLSEDPRLDHVAMNGTVIQQGQTFDFPDGVSMAHPHDPAGGAKHSINCRCIAVYRVVPKR